MKKVEFFIGIATLALVGYYVWVKGGHEGETMAKCVDDKMSGLAEYMSDKEVMYRLSVSACQRYNRDGIVKVPIGGE